MGVVLYVGDEKLRMKDALSFFGFHYTCRMLDVRLLNPEAFLSSDDPGEIIFAVLAGQGSPEERVAIIHRIFSTLQQRYANDPFMLQVKIRQMELLSLLRGETMQQFIIQEGQKMPVTIDITKDLRYKQGKEDERVKIAEEMFKSASDIFFIQKITGLPMSRLEEILKKVNGKNTSV